MRLSLTALLLPFATATALAGTPLPDTPHVVVQGEAERSVAPDWAIVTMVAHSRSADPGEAKRVVDRAIDGVMQIAPTFNVTPEHMSASDLSLHEDVEYRREHRPSSPHHIASREVKVRLDDLQRLGEYMDAALAAGMTAVGGVEFKSSQEARLREEARRAAVADANEKAASLAAAFEARLGRVYSINSLHSMQYFGYGNRLLRASAIGRIPGGAYLQPKVDFTEEVSAVFELSR